MALTAKLQIRQSQSLVMTPQLMQSIALLQYSHQELADFVAGALESNPLLELTDENQQQEREMPDAAPQDHADPIGSELETSLDGLESNLGTSLDNVFEAGTGEQATPPQLSDPWKSVSATASLDSGAGDIDAWCARQPTLREHLNQQAAMAFRYQSERQLAEIIIDSLDEDGYLRRPLGEISAQQGHAPEQIEQAIAKIQQFDPSGVCARNLAECLSIQLAERNRLDPAMAMLLRNLDLLAKRDYGGLARLCGLERAEIADMAAEIRQLDPRPGRRFEHEPVQSVVADVQVSARQDGNWAIELNPETLPKVLVNRTYQALALRKCRDEAQKTYLTDCLQNANWLVRSLDQRAQTILKVAVEIVKQQDMFLLHGIEYLRPLNLKTVADAIKMHESTVSRVTTNKYMMTPRGLFEMKYFFTQAIASSSGDDAHSAEAVRHKIRQMVENEAAGQVLSDEAVVEHLRKSGVEIARRTVAKYRESMNIPSSAQRRREKQAFAIGQLG